MMKLLPWSTELRGTTALYVVTLGAVAILSLVGQSLVQWQLRRQEHDSRTVNVAGRQRMLGQQIVKAALDLSTDDAERQAVRLQELKAAAAEWEQAGGSLRNAKDNPPHVERMFAALDEHYLPMRESLQRLIDSSAAAPADCVQILLRHEAAFLQGMDGIVNEYDRLAAQRVASLQRLEMLLLGATLSVLLAEGLLVFRPAMRRIRRHVDDLRRGSEELQLARRAAEAASRAKSEFLSHLSHEVRTPMNAIVGLAEVVLNDELSPSQRQRLQAMNDSAGVLLELLNNSLDLAKIEAGRLELECRPFELRALGRSLYDSYASAAEKKGVMLRLTIADDVPPSVAGDSLRLRQVLANLLSNAVKFTVAGEIELRLAIGELSDERVRLTFAVSDTGTGIAPEKQAAVFEPFVQEDSSTTRRFGGSGLGLSIAAQLVRAMRGELSLQNRPGKGSTFSFSADFGAVAATELQASASSEASTVGVLPCRSLRILAAEDSAANRLLLATLLESAGHGLLLVETGVEAVQAFAADAWDCVLLDVQMPDMDGLAATRAMRELERQRDAASPTPIVAVTAYAAPEDRERCLAAGMTDYLAKPLRGRELLELLGRLTSVGPPGACLPSLAPSIACKSAAAPVDAVAAIARLDGNRRLYDKLAELFAAESPQMLEELRRAVSSRDAAKTELLAHRLQGQLGGLGAFSAAAAACELETAAGSPSAAAGFARFQAAWSAAHRKLAEHLSSAS